MRIYITNWSAAVTMGVDSTAAKTKICSVYDKRPKDGCMVNLEIKVIYRSLKGHSKFAKQKVSKVVIIHLFKSVIIMRKHILNKRGVNGLIP